MTAKNLGVSTILSITWAFLLRSVRDVPSEQPVGLMQENAHRDEPVQALPPTLDGAHFHVCKRMQY